jgi:L-ornithine N5-oxygenase
MVQAAQPAAPGAGASRESGPIHDVIGVGFGPSNLALAAVIEEQAEATGCRPVSSVFLERRPAYAWHPAMLLGGALVQISFLKDLATLRNPRSKFTFLNYLRARGRLERFINLRNFYPTRLEFNDYFAWVAEQVQDQVRYGHEVVAVTPLRAARGEGVELLAVHARKVSSGAIEELTARNLVVATGGVPFIPECAGSPAGAETRIFHSQDFLTALARTFTAAAAPYRFIVVGSGQSAAEVFLHLVQSFPNATVTAALRRFAFKPADNSEFVNEIFSPQMVDFLYDLPAATRRTVLRQHEDTNYSAVDAELIQSIYRLLYERSVAGDTRATIRPFLELSGLEQDGDRVIAAFYDSAHERVETLEADGVVLATGYRRDRRHPLLRELEAYFVSDGGGGYRVTRDYRVVTAESFAPQVFLQGFCEGTHGLADTLLSVLPARCAEILQALAVARMPGLVELDRAAGR